MGPQDQRHVLLDGFTCTVCDERVSADRVRVLAQRDDLLFVQFDCTGCGSTALAFITEEDGGVTPRRDVDRLAGGALVSSDDVLDMHELLESWTGDLVALVDERGAARAHRTAPGGRSTGHGHAA